MAPTPEVVRLAKRLRDLRESRRLTQADLAGAFNVSVPAISSWESESKTKVPPEERLRVYALFFSQTDVAIDARHLPREQDVAPADRERFDGLRDELVSLRDAATGRVGSEISTTSTWAFETGPITIICPEAPIEGRSPLAEDRNPNHTRLYRYADLDALMELWGHIRAFNPENDVAHRLSTELVADDLSGDLVVLGGIGWNRFADRLQQVLDELPFAQVSVPDLENGEIFRLREPHGQEFRPRWLDRKGARRETMDSGKIKAEQAQDAWHNGKRRELVEDVGLLARLPNPFNHSRTITICSGVYSRGVLGSVRTLTDTAVRKENEAYVARRFPSGSFAILMRVMVVNGEALSPDLENPENRLYEWSPEVPAA
ncbi:helix-turn-helix transcriptional regulator [Kribbella sp. NPDC026596]|uniref:helix-turn-helix domain-containing protein n=1 Tax=Kribbella sp. NPDC026596 TaxID=3155122 RepID=UPI0033EDAE0C